MRTQHSAFLLAAACLALARAAWTADAVSYPDFSSVAGLTLNGSAAQFDNRLRLAPADAADWVSGSAWIGAKEGVRDGFTTTFTFQLTDQDPFYGGGDGFAFVVQNASPTALGAPGRGIGYGGGDADSGGIPDSLAVEFDTYQNEDDPNDNHVSVQSRGTQPNSDDEQYSLGVTTQIPRLKDGTVHTSRIDYSPGSLSIYLDDPASPALTVPVDLDALLQLDAGTAYVGFTGSVAAAKENHDILSWSYSSPVAPPPTPQALAATAVSATQVDLSWTLPGPGAESVDVERSGSGGTYDLIAAVGGSSMSYTDTTVSPGTSYAYRVRSANAAGQSPYSNVATVSTPPPPPTVTAAEFGLPELQYASSNGSLTARIPVWMKGSGSGTITGSVTQGSPGVLNYRSVVSLKPDSWTSADPVVAHLLVGATTYSFQGNFGAGGGTQTGLVALTLTGFVPAKDGFPFANTNAIKPKELPGLCVGMSRLSHDYFEQGIPIPSGSRPSQKLLKALVRSHKSGNRYIAYVDFPRVGLYLSDGGAVASELARVEAELSTGEPAVTGLVASRVLWAPHDGHCVLIVASADCSHAFVGGISDQNVSRLAAYDPNLPGIYSYLDVDRTSGVDLLSYPVAGEAMHFLVTYTGT